MKKAVDVNERTFEEEKKDFALVCRVFEVLCVVLLAVFAVGALAVTVIIAIMGADMKDVLVLFVNSIVPIFGIVSALNFGRAIFRTLKDGETPFRYDIADKVKGASYALILSSFAAILLQSASHLFSEKFSDICHYFFFLTIGSLVVGLLLGVMSYVMNYGCKLQQESDETL